MGIRCAGRPGADHDDLTLGDLDAPTPSAGLHHGFDRLGEVKSARRATLVGRPMGNRRRAVGLCEVGVKPHFQPDLDEAADRF